MHPPVQIISPWLALDDDALLCTFAFFPMQTMIKAARACRRFRTLALASPSLWWDANIDKKHPHRVARFLGVLQRGAGAPVHINISDPRVLHGPQDRVLCALEEHAYRIVRLSLMLDSEDQTTAPRIAALVRSGAMCSLQTLVVVQLSTQTTLSGADTIANTASVVKIPAPRLRRIAIPSLYLSILPVLDTVEEGNIFVADVTEAVLTELFTRLPRVRRLMLQAEQLHHVGLTPCMGRLQALMELRIERIRVSEEWRHIDTHDIPTLLRSQIPNMSLHLAYPDVDRNSDIRAALQTLPGPWTLSVRDHRCTWWNDLNSPGIDVCVHTADGRRREWTLPSFAEAFSSAFRPLLLDTRTTELVLDGPSAWALALRAAEPETTTHVRALHVVLPFTRPREKSAQRKKLQLHGLCKIVVLSRPGDETRIPAAQIRDILERLPANEEGVYPLEVRGLRIDGLVECATSFAVMR